MGNEYGSKSGTGDFRNGRQSSEVDREILFWIFFRTKDQEQLGLTDRRGRSDPLENWNRDMRFQLWK